MSENKNDLKKLILSSFNEQFDTTYTTYEELLSFLNDEFDKQVDKHSDVQTAYDYLDDDYDGFIGEHFVFFSENGPWSVEYSDDLPETVVSEAISSVNSYYDRVDINLDDVASTLEHFVMKCMSNVGADPVNSLNSILGDLAIDEGAFFISGFDGPYVLDIL